MPLKYFILTNSSLLCLLIGLILLALPLCAALIDFNADAVEAVTGGAIANGTKALGVPNGTFATVAGVFDNHVVLDIGSAQEGTSNLRVTYRGLVSIPTNVEFLDAHHQLIAASSLNLVGLGLGSSYTATVTSPNALMPYRYVRLVALAS